MPRKWMSALLSYVKKEPSIVLHVGLAAYLIRLCVNTLIEGFATNRATITQGDNPETRGLLDTTWVQEISKNSRYRRIICEEWENQNWRMRNGWKGQDLIHSKSAAVQILAYWWDEEEQSLVGVVFFSKNAESHRGLCHGGSMCSVFDDILGWTCFAAGKGPWCGATVQVNCKLKKPVKVGSLLKVTSRIQKRDRKKVFVTATLTEGDDGEELYAELDGIGLDGVQLSSHADEVSCRVWAKDSASYVA